MFICTPKPKANRNGDANPPPPPQPIAKITAATKVARVRTACDRCRMKKVKCDGDLPCLRCSKDKILCVTTKKTSNDPKSEYVHSLESQQTRLIEALRKLHRHVKQPIEERDMQEILQTVRACGFDFEDVQDTQNNPSESNTPDVGHDNRKPFGNGATSGSNNKDTNGRSRISGTDLATGHDCLGKRKRADFGQPLNTSITPGSNVTVIGNVEDSLTNTNGGSDWADKSQTSHLKRSKPAAPPESVDDSWNFDNYFEQVATPYNPSKPPTTSSTTVSSPMLDVNLQNVSNSLQQPSEMPAWSWNDLSQPLTTTDADPTVDVNGTASTHPVRESSEALPFFEVPNDWESTMWWDPSLLFDTRLEAPHLDGMDLPTQPLDLRHDVNKGLFGRNNDSQGDLRCQQLPNPQIIKYYGNLGPLSRSSE